MADLQSWWPRVVAAAAGDAPLKPLFASLVPVKVTDTTLTLDSAVAHAFTERTRTAIQRRVEQVTGAKLGIDVRQAAEAAPSPTPAHAAAMAPNPAVSVDNIEDVPSDEELESGNHDAGAAGSQPAGASDDEAPGDDGLALFQSAFDATELPSK